MSGLSTCPDTIENALDDVIQKLTLLLKSDFDRSIRQSSKRPAAAFLSSIHMSDLLVTSSQFDRTEFSNDPNERNPRKHISKSGDERLMEIFHRPFSCVDPFFVSPQEEWQLSLISEWMPGCRPEPESLEEESDGSENLFSDHEGENNLHSSEDVSKRDKQSQSTKSTMCSPRSKISRPLSLSNDHVKRDIGVLIDDEQSLQDDACTSSTPYKVSNRKSLDLHATEQSPILDTSLENRLQMVDNCLVKTLQILVDPAKSYLDKQQSPNSKDSQISKKKASPVPEASTKRYLDKQQSPNSKDSHISKKKASPVPEASTSSTEKNRECAHDKPQKAKRKLCSTFQMFTDKGDTGVQMDKPRSYHGAQSQRSNFSQPHESSKGLSNQNIANTYRKCLANNRNAVSEIMGETSQVSFESSAVKLSSKSKRKVRSVAIRVIPSNCDQVLKIKRGSLLDDETAKNHYLVRLMPHGNPLTVDRIKVEDSSFSKPDRDSSSLQPPTNSFLDRTIKLSPSLRSKRRKIQQSNYSGGSCDGDQDSAFQREVAPRTRKMVSLGGTNGNSAKSGLDRNIPCTRQHDSVSSIMSGSEFLQASNNSKSKKSTDPMELSNDAVKDLRHSVGNKLPPVIAESQGFIPTPEENASPESGTIIEEHLIASTQAFIPSLNDDLDNTQTQD